MSLTIRLITPDDYGTICEIINAAYPADAAQWEPEATRNWDSRIDAKYRLRRHAVEADGRIVATSRINHTPSRYNPHEFDIHLMVHPECQGRGYGRALYEYLSDLMAPGNPTCVRSRCREDTPRALRFLQERGFVEENRDWESFLDLTRFDPTPYRDLLDDMRRQGIAIRTLGELKAEDGWERKLYDLTMHVQADMPMTVPYVPFPFEDFMRIVMESPNTRPDTYFVATDGDRYVGLTILMADPSDSTNLNTDDTGVHRDYRRRGIARTLKAHSIKHAAELGYQSIRTVNESTNKPMLTINGELGFVKRPAWIWFLRTIAQQAHGESNADFSPSPHPAPT